MESSCRQTGRSRRGLRVIAAIAGVGILAAVALAIFMEPPEKRPGKIRIESVTMVRGTLSMSGKIIHPGSTPLLVRGTGGSVAAGIEYDFASVRDIEHFMGSAPFPLKTGETSVYADASTARYLDLKFRLFVYAERPPKWATFWQFLADHLPGKLQTWCRNKLRPEFDLFCSDWTSWAEWKDQSANENSVPARP